MASRERHSASQENTHLAGGPSAAGEAAFSFGGRVDPTLLRIALFFVVTFAVFDALLLGATYTDAFFGVMEATAAAATMLINATGVPASNIGTDIFLSTRILRIDPDCTGLLIVAMFLSLVIAYPVSLRTKAIGALIGIPVLLVANMSRLVAVAHVSEQLPDASFAFAHDFLFKVFLVAVVIGLWAWWLAYARRQAGR